LEAERRGKSQQLTKLSKVKRLSQEQEDQQAELISEIANLDNQLKPFGEHKKQIENQRKYIRKRENELTPRGCVCVVLVWCVCVCVCVCYVSVCPDPDQPDAKYDVIVWQDFVSQYNIHGKKVLQLLSLLQLRR
jgi:hypothetical protein